MSVKCPCPSSTRPGPEYAHMPANPALPLNRIREALNASPAKKRDVGSSVDGTGTIHHDD